MIPGSVTLQLATAANAANIVASNTPAAAGNLTLVTSPWVADAPRRVLVTFGSEASARAILITGTDRYSNAITETLSIPSGGASTTYTKQDFARVTAVTVFAAWTAAMTVGTNGVGSTTWFVTQRYITPMTIGIGVVVSGTVNFTVEYTYDDPLLTPAKSGLVAPQQWPLTGLTSLAINTDGVLTTPVTAYRLTVNSGTGSARMSSLQAGNRQ